jgi:uncharacterized protein YjiS (DUF1127 family)
MQKSFSHDTKVFSASNQIIVDDTFMIEMHLKANKLRAKAFAQLANFVASFVVASLAGTAKWFNSKAQNSRVMGQLYSMDDRALADIGITRGDIEGVVNGTWVREPFQPLADNLQLIQTTKTSKTGVVQDDTRIAA